MIFERSLKKRGKKQGPSVLPCGKPTLRVSVALCLPSCLILSTRYKVRFDPGEF